MTRHIHGWTRLSLVAALAVGLAACNQDAPSPIEPAGPGLTLSKAPGSAGLVADLSRMLDDANRALAADGAPYRVLKVETISGSPDEVGVEVLWKDVGNKRLANDFVPGDLRRALGSPEGGWSPDPNRMTYAIDPVQGATANGVGAATTSAEIRSAMETWDDAVCSNLNITELPAAGDIGFVAWILSGGAVGSLDGFGDIHHAGWQQIEFGGGTVAATFTIIWVDGITGVPTDIDGDGRIDVAFREIYYDAVCDACAPPALWTWEVDNGINDPGPDIDIQSIALHEAGHGLSQAHFGTGFFTPTGQLKLTSNSVMAAAYVFPTIDLQGSDIGGHCANWGSWPNN